MSNDPQAWSEIPDDEPTDLHPTQQAEPQYVAPAAAPPAAAGPATSTVVMWTVGGVAAIAAVAVLAGWLMMRSDNGASDPTTIAAPTTTQSVSTSVSATSSSTTSATTATSPTSPTTDSSTPQTSATSSTPPSTTSASPTPTPTVDPQALGIPAGADTQGWTQAAARCHGSDPAVAIGQTTSATFAICVNPADGSQYYRGTTNQGSLEAPVTARTSNSFTVTNGNTVYRFDDDQLTVTQNGTTTRTDPMQTWWVGGA